VSVILSATDGSNRLVSKLSSMSVWEPIMPPQHAPLILEERLRDQQADDVKMPDGMPLDELALRLLIAAQTGRVPRLG
jgi:hypothetical protein